MADPLARTTGRLAVVGVAVATGVLLAGCSGGSGPGGSPSTVASSSAGSSTAGSAAADPATAANGVEALPPDQIVAKAKAAAKAASWVHVTGTQNGTTLDLHVGRGQATGSLSEDGVTAQVLAVGGHTYLKGDKKFWDDSLGIDIGEKLAGRWVIADKYAASLASFTDIGRLFDLVLTSQGPVTKGAVTTVDGVRAVAVVDGAAGQQLYVATTGQPYPVTIRTTGSTAAPPTFDGWNTPVRISPPASSQVLDPATLDL